MPTIGEILYGVGADTTRLRAALEDIKKFSSQMSQAADTVVSATSKANAALNSTATTAKRASVEHSAFAESMRNLSRAASLTAGPLSGVAFRITLLGELLSKGTLQTSLFVAGLAGAAYGFLKLGEAAVHTEMHLTQIRNSLFALSGNWIQTGLDMQFVMDTADKFGLKFQDIAHNFAQLDTAARGTRLQGQGVRDMFAQIASVAGTTSMSAEKLTGTFNVLERMLSMGVVQWRNLREIAREMPNIFELISDAIGVHSVAALQNFLKLGTVTADVLLPKLVAAWVKAYGIDAQKPIDNLVASHNRLYNAILRFNDALNSSAGFAAGAQRTYDTLRNVLDSLSNNMETVRKVTVTLAGALGGLLIYFTASWVISGIRAFTASLEGLRLVVLGLNVAAAASPFGWIKLLAVIGGAIVGYKYLDDAVKGTNESLLNSKAPVNDYIDNWNKLKKGLSSDTQTYITDVQQKIKSLNDELAKSGTDIAAAQQKFESLSASLEAGGGGKPAGWFTPGVSPVSIDQVHAAAAAVQELFDKQRSLTTEQQRARETLAQLVVIQGRQLEIEKNMPGQVAGENQALMRKLNAYEKLREQIREYDEALQAAHEGTYAEAKTAELNKIAKAIELVRIELQQAGYTWDRVSQTFTDPKVEKSFEELAAKMRQVKDIQLFDKYFVQSWQLAEEAIQGLTKGALDVMIDELNKGKLTWQNFGQALISVLGSIEKKLLEMSVVNPLLNALFGGGPTGKPLPVFTLGSGGTQPGGFFGSLFGGGSAPATTAATSQHGGSGAVKHLTMPWSTFAGAPRLHEGLAPDEYPAILQQGEEVIPREVVDQAVTR